MNEQPRPANLTALLEDARRRRIGPGTRTKTGLSALLLTVALTAPASSQDIAEACERVATYQFGPSEIRSDDVQAFPELDPPRVRIRISGETGQQDLIAQALGRALGQPDPAEPSRVSYGQVFCQFEDPAPPFGLIAFECSGPGCPVSAMRLEELRVLLHREYGSGEPLVPLSERTGPGSGSEPPSALIDSVRQCWNMGVLSQEAMRVTVTVGFRMGASGRHEPGSIRLITASGGDERAIAQSFEAARRAIIRCEGDGYPTPPNQTGEVRLLFDGARMELRSEAEHAPDPEPSPGLQTD